METLWTRTARNKFSSNSDPPRRVDVAVIGGGFTGLTAAREICIAGRSVAVLEAGTIGSGASGMNAGFVVPNFAKSDPSATRAKLGEERGDALLCLVGDGANAVFRTVEEEGITCDALQCGWLNPSASEADADILRKRAEFWRGFGRPVTFIGAEEVRAQTGMGIYTGALLDPDGGTIHPLDYARGLAAAVERRGGTVHEGHRVKNVAPHVGGWSLTISGGVEVLAHKVLLCTNAFTTGAASPLGRTTVPLRVYQIATAPLDDSIVKRIAPDRRPVGDLRPRFFTYRIDRDNRLIGGATVAFPVGAQERAGRMSVRRLSSELSLPDGIQPEIVWTGVAAMTLDFLPRFYQFGEGWFGGIGCNGRGIAMTAQLGRVLARAALGEDPTRLPVPLSKAKPIPFHSLSPLLASAALIDSRIRDRIARYNRR